MRLGRSSTLPEHVRVEQELYEGRRRALDQLLAGFLVEEAARASGVSGDEYVNGPDGAALAADVQRRCRGLLQRERGAAGRQTP